MTHEEYDAWLTSLEPGDEVWVSNRYGGRIFKIKRLTPTMIVVNDQHRFRRNSGMVVGDGYSRVQPVTDHEREIVETEMMHNWVRSLEQNHRVRPPLNVLRAMKAVYDELMPKP